MSLPEYLASAARRPFAWGSRDCCLWAADWLILCGYADPAGQWRGRYRTAIGAARLMNKRGGFVAFFSSQAALVGLKRTSNPGFGDIGLVNVGDQDGRPKPAAAICTGHRWAVLAPRGLLAFPTKPLAAWRV